jgi:hypothetical protein
LLQRLKDQNLGRGVSGWQSSVSAVSGMDGVMPEVVRLQAAAALDTLLAMIEAGEIAHTQTRTELLAAITTILDAGRAAGDLRRDVTAEDIAASLIGIFTVAPRPEHEAKASRLLNLLMDGLRPPPG